MRLTTTVGNNITSFQELKLLLTRDDCCLEEIEKLTVPYIEPFSLNLLRHECIEIAKMKLENIDKQQRKIILSLLQNLKCN